MSSSGEFSARQILCSSVPLSQSHSCCATPLYVERGDSPSNGSLDQGMGRKPRNITLVSCAVKRQIVVMLRDMDGASGDSSKPKALYMVVEHFKNKDAVAVYRRFRDSGRMAPEGLRYVSSWVDDNLERCYQLMETHDRMLLDEWMANWSDLVD